MLDLYDARGRKMFSSSRYKKPKVYGHNNNSNVSEYIIKIK